MQAATQELLADLVAHHVCLTRIGVDLVDVASFTHNHDVGGDRWLRKLFTADELAGADGDLDQLAATFAAKEAIVKALGTGFRGVRARDIQIARTPHGQPVAHLTGEAALVAARRRVHVQVSISRESGYALAAAVLITPLTPPSVEGDGDEPSAS